jgi:hypothetical protein
MNSKNTPAPSLVRSRVHWIQIQGQPVLMIDFNHSTPAESLAMLDELDRVFEGQALKSVRALSDLTEVVYDPSVSQRWKSALLKYSPYMRASASYGATGLAVVATMAAIELLEWFQIPVLGGRIRLFKNKEKALAWLLKD